MPEIVCISPIDGKVVDRRATATQGSIQKALNAAWKARREWAHVQHMATGLCSNSTRLLRSASYAL